MEGSTPPPPTGPRPGSEPPILQHLSTLGDETRVRLLRILSIGEFPVGELCRILHLPQSTVSRHLRVLFDGGWVSARSEGTSRLYRFRSPKEQSEAELWRVVEGGVGSSTAAREDTERAGALLATRRDRTRAFFRTAAGRWDALRAELFGAGTESAALLGLLDPDEVVGDLGCGTGGFAALIAPFAGRVIGVDREPGMLEAALHRLDGVPNVEVRQGDLEALPLRHGELDTAFLTLVLHLVPDPVEVLREVARVLRPGGRLVIIDMREHGREELREEMGHLWTGFDPQVLEGWMADAGFQSIRVHPLPPEAGATGPLLLMARGRRSPRSAAP